MVKFEVKRETKKVALDYIEGGEVETYTSILGADIEKMQKSGILEGANKDSVAPLMYLIKDWNMEDEAGQKVPVTLDNIKKLDFKDLLKIYRESGFNEGEDFLSPKG
jgi:hypothetical protein